MKHSDAPLEVFFAMPCDGYEVVHPVDGKDWDFFREHINGTPQLGNWNPPEVKIVSEWPEEGVFQPADVPWFGGHTLMLKRKAARLLGPFLRDYGQLLPVPCATDEMFVFNPTVVIPALDESNSTLRRFKSGDIMFVTRHAFRIEVVEGNDIFKLTELRSSSIFFTSRAVKIWTDSGVTGIEFDRIWPRGEG